MGSFSFYNFLRGCAPVGTMDVRAILVVEHSAENLPAVPPGAAGLPYAKGAISGIPMALLPVLGRSITVRVAEALAGAGVDQVSIISSASPAAWIEQELLGAQAKWKQATEENLWRVTEEQFSDFAQDGAELVLVWRIGAYADIDLDHLLQFHLDQRSRVTQVCDAQGRLDIFVISASRRNDAAHLFRTRLMQPRMALREYQISGYVNRLANPDDFRQLAVDSLMLKTSLRPVGKEIRPGIWKAEGARIDRRARIVAPAYIGAYARVRNAALVTRCSSVEHHSIVDCGTAVDNSTILPFSYMGVGLDLCNSILSEQQIVHLKRKAVVTIEDPRLVDSVPQTVAVRVLEHAAGLIAFLPRQLWRGFRGEKAASQPVLAEAANVEIQRFDPPVGEERNTTKAEAFENDLAIMRRYGNQ